MKLTADTITDDQIRDLYERGEVDHITTVQALSTDECNRRNKEQRQARARCAEILNARNTK